MFLQISQCNAVLFIFSPVKPRKLALQITCTAASHRFLDFVNFPLQVESINDLLEEKLLQGSIEDNALINNVHIYMYKFDNTEKCSDTTSLEVPTKKDYITQAFPIQLKTNVRWSFFSLEQDAGLDLKQDFPDNTLNVNDDYIFKVPKNEHERVESLLTTLIM